MKTRRPRRRRDVSQRETPFFSKNDGQTDVGARVQEGFFQPRLTIGKPADRFEQEADRLADSVVDGTRTGSNDVTAVLKKEKAQRQAEEDKEIPDKAERQRQAEEEEASVQAQAEEEEEAVQSQVEDEEESIQTQSEEEDEPVQAQGEEEEESVQAQTEEEEETVRAQAEEEQGAQAKPELQSKDEDKETIAPASSRAQRGNEDLAARLQQQKGRGRPLPPELRAEMEAALDADFGAVRIHIDEEAAQLCKMLGAQAFTHGNDIYFNSGRFNPDTEAGKRLLVHELTHVKQQKGREG